MSRTAEAWTCGLSLFLGLGWATPIFGGQWAGFALGQFGACHIALLSVFPVGLKQIRSVILRVNAVRFFTALPLWLAGGVWLAKSFDLALLEGLKYGAEAWLMLLLFQPFFLVFKYSQGTNDTNSGCLTVLAFFGMALLSLAALATAFCTMVFGASWQWQSGSMIAIGLTSLAFEAVYRRLYTAQRFDLLAVSGQNTT